MKQRIASSEDDSQKNELKTLKPLFIIFIAYSLVVLLASQFHFLANKNAELAISPLFWPVNCIKIGGHVALLSDPTVHSLYCATALTITPLCQFLNSHTFFILPNRFLPL